MLFGILVLVALATPQAPAQDGGPDTPSKMSFDAVSVRPMHPGSRDRMESYCAAGGRFVSRGTPLLWSIKWAYRLNDYQVDDRWPVWLNAFDAYEIEAESERRVTEDECRAMVRSMFEERFRLRMHRYTRTVSAYALVVARRGPALSTAGGVRINGVASQAASEREAPPGWTMPRLANYLATLRDVQRPVIDRTQLPGVYGFVPQLLNGRE